MGLVVSYPIMNLNEMQAEDVAGMKHLKDRRFNMPGKKVANAKMAHLYEVAGWPEYANRAAACATHLEYGYWEKDGDLRLQFGNFCQLRLCPMCTARRARKLAHRLSTVMNLTESKHGYKFIFLTLTIENVEGDELGAALSQLAQAWNRLMQQRPVLRAVKGWYRAIEITHGKYTGYHPHIHAILAVEPEYLKRNSPIYIKQAEWVERWKKALKIDYKPIVHIQKIKNRKGGMGAVLEASKYAAKDSDYIDPKLSVEEGARILTDYTKALHKRRLVAFGGCMKEIAAQIGADREDNDLVHLDDEGIRDDLADLIEVYGWHFGAGDYILTDRRVNPLKEERQDG